MIKRSFQRGEADETELGMLENNSIAGLVPMELHEAGETVLCVYHDDGFTVLDGLMNSDAGNLYLYAVIYALALAGKELREHFLDENRLSLLPQEIFVDEAAGKVLFLYDPVKKKCFQESLQRLMEYFLKVINPAEEQRILFLYGLYRKSREEHVLPETLLQYWKEHAPEEKYSSEENYAPAGNYSSEKMMLRREEAGSRPDAGFRDFSENLLDETAYVEPGLYQPKNRAFEVWRKKRSAEGAAAERENLPMDQGENEIDLSDYEASPFGEKLKAFLKKYGYGLVIAAILLIGILLFFLI